MGAPLSDIIGREKRSLSPNTITPKEETLKSDPTLENSGVGENPSENTFESRIEHLKGALTLEEEAIVGDPENAKQGEEIADSDTPGDADPDFGLEETGPGFADPSKT